MAHPNDKLITIKPNIKSGLKRIQMNNPNTFEIVHNISSYHGDTGKRPATGMDDAERDILMPIVLGMDVTDRDYHKNVDAYFHEITTKVGTTGITLNVGMTYDNDMGLQVLNPSYDPKKHSVDKKFTLNLPLHIEQYIAYRHALKHPWVAHSSEEALSSPIAKFYIEDSEVEIKKKVESTAIKRKANTILYTEVAEDVEKVDMYLTLMGVDTRYKTNEEKNTMIDIEVGNNPEKFLEVHADENAKDKYTIMTYIRSGVLNQEGMAIVDAQTNMEIGHDLMEAVRYLRDKKNSDTANLFAVRHKEYLKSNL